MRRRRAWAVVSVLVVGAACGDDGAGTGGGGQGGDAASTATGTGGVITVSSASQGGSAAETTTTTASSSSGGGGEPVQVVFDLPCDGLTPVATVTASDFVYTPSTVTIGVGEILEFVTNGSHDMEGPDNSWDTGTPGIGRCLRFDAAGTYPYFCSIHPEMTGTVIVE